MNDLSLQIKLQLSAFTRVCRRISPNVCKSNENKLTTPEENPRTLLYPKRLQLYKSYKSSQTLLRVFVYIMRGGISKNLLSSPDLQEKIHFFGYGYGSFHFTDPSESHSSFVTRHSKGQAILDDGLITNNQSVILLEIVSVHFRGKINFEI